MRGRFILITDNQLIMDSAVSYIKYFTLYGPLYWAIDFVFQFARFSHWLWMFCITFVVPVIMCFAIHAIFKKTAAKKHPTSLPLLSLLGLWVFGPLAIGLEMVPLGGKFFETGIEGLLTLTMYFPISTLSMSTYSGSLGGLLLITISLPVMAVYLRKKGNDIE